MAIWIPFVGPAIGLARDAQQSRRKVKLTVHRAFAAYVSPSYTTTRTVLSAPDDFDDVENLYITITNASPTRDIVVTHIWLDARLVSLSRAHTRARVHTAAACTRARYMEAGLSERA